MILKLGIPKGSLESATIDLFRGAGFSMTVSRRSDFPVIDDPEIECLLMDTRALRRMQPGCAVCHQPTPYCPFIQTTL